VVWEGGRGGEANVHGNSEQVMHVVVVGRELGNEVAGSTDMVPRWGTNMGRKPPCPEVGGGAGDWR